MIYAYDQQAQMPVRDLFDTQMMAMAISAAKDMYDRQEQRIEKFRDKYGSFYSPTQSHMDFYNENFNTGKFLDDLYSRGIDPLRSAEGRALVQQWINSRPISELEQYKKSAENYQKFQDNVAQLQNKGLYNPEFQDFVLNGKNINNLKRGEIWDVTAATPYQNLTQYADPLFNGMDSSYINTENGYDIYGITPERRQQVLTATMGDILSTPLGRFHYEKARQNAAILLNRTPTEEEVQKQFANDVITATKKYDSIKKVENPDAKREKEFKYSKALHAANAATDHYYKMKERANTSGFDANGNPISESQSGYSIKEYGYNSALANVMGSGYDPNNMDYASANKNIKRVQTDFGKTSGDNKEAFKNRYTSFNSMHVEDIKQLHGGNITDLGFQANMGDVRKIKSVDDVVTNTYGYKGKKTNSSKQLQDKVQEALNAGKFVEILPKDGIYGAYNKNNQFSVDAPSRIRIYDNPDGTGNFVDYEGYWNLDWDSQDSPIKPEYEAPTVPISGSFSASGRLLQDWQEHNSLVSKLNQQNDLPSNVYPYQRDAASETLATNKRFNVPFNSNAGLYK